MRHGMDGGRPRHGLHLALELDLDDALVLVGDPASPLGPSIGTSLAPKAVWFPDEVEICYARTRLGLRKCAGMARDYLWRAIQRGPAASGGSILSRFPIKKTGTSAPVFFA